MKKREGKIPRKSINLETKVKVLKRYDEGVGASAVGREFRMAESTVRTIVKNKERIIQSSTLTPPLLAKKLNRARGAIFEKMEQQLSSWVVEMNRKDVPLTQVMVMVEAKRLFGEIKEMEGVSSAVFKASRGWFDRFKRRANLVLVRRKNICSSKKGVMTQTFRSINVFDNPKRRSVVQNRRNSCLRNYLLRKDVKGSRLKCRNLEQRKHFFREKSSPRVTLRLHQLKEKREKAKSNAAADKAAHHDNYNGNMESKGTDDSSAIKEPVAVSEEVEPSGEQGAKETIASSPKELHESESSKRCHTTEEDVGTSDENRKKRRVKNGSNSGGSPKSIIESEGEDAKSVGSPGPKVPPLKIVIAGTSLEEQGSGRTGKNGSSRHHLSYVVSTSSGGEGEACSPPSDYHEDLGSGKRILRSHRSGGGSGNSSPATVAGETPPRFGITSPPPQQPDIEEKPVEEPAHVELHPRKRKLRPKESQLNSNAGQVVNSQSQPALEHPIEQHTGDFSVTNSFQLFLNIRKQIEKKRKGLFPVQPKPPQGFKDYLMNRCTYVLAGNSSNRVPPPNTNPPASIPDLMRVLYITQEKERHRLVTQHVIEKEKLVLSVEQEILRVHGRAARALANQNLPFSACTILRDEEIYSAITPEQEEKDRNARSRYNGRLFLSWLQDVDDKWEKIKEAMLLRHHNEAESLHAVQIMDWEWKLKEVGLCDFKSKPTIDEIQVPQVHVSDDFDLLPA